MSELAEKIAEVASEIEGAMPGTVRAQRRQRGRGKQPRSQSAKLEQAKRAAAGVSAETGALWQAWEERAATVLDAEHNGRTARYADFVESTARLLATKPAPKRLDFAERMLNLGLARQHQTGAEGTEKRGPYHQICDRAIRLARWSDTGLMSEAHAKALLKAGGSVTIGDKSYGNTLDALRKSGATVNGVLEAFRAVIAPPRPAQYRKSPEQRLTELWTTFAVKYRDAKRKVVRVLVREHAGCLDTLATLIMTARTALAAAQARADAEAAKAE